MIRLSHRFARNRQQAWHEASWLIWNTPGAQDSVEYCNAQRRLWQWIETAIHDMNDKARKGVLA